MFDGSATFHRLKRWPLGVLLLALLFPRAAQPSENDQIASGFPVVLDSRTVTVIYAPNGGISAADRAKGIAQRLEEFAENRSLPLDLIQIEELPGHGTIIFARNTILMGVTDADAADAHLSKPALATQIVASMRDAVSQYRRDWSAKNVISTYCMRSLPPPFSWCFSMGWHRSTESGAGAFSPGPSPSG